MLGNFLNPLFKEHSLLFEGASVSASHFRFELIGKSLRGFISLITEIALSSVNEPLSFVSNGISELRPALVKYFIHDFSASLHFSFLLIGEIVNTLKEFVLLEEGLVDELSPLIWVNILVYVLESVPEEF